jgi:integrase
MFDPREAKLLQPGEHMKIDGCPGLRLEASEKYRTWTYRYKSPVDNRMRQIRLGRWPAMSYAAALGEWDKARQDRERGEDVAIQIRQERQEKKALSAKRTDDISPLTYPVRHCIEDYTRHLTRVRKEKGVSEIRRLFSTMLPDDFMAMPVSKVTRAIAFNVLEARLDTPVLAANLKGELAGAWDYALDAGRIPEETPNWWRQIMRGKLRSKGRKVAGEYVTARRVLSQDELRTLLAFMPNFSRLVEDGLYLYLWTGCRGSEIVQIEGKEVEEVDGALWWTIPKAKTKNARYPHATDLRVPLFGRACEVVTRRKRLYGEGHLFPSRSGRYPYSEQKVFGCGVHFHMPYSNTKSKRERERLTVTHWAPHDLRRTVRTHLAALGCPDHVAEAVLGHMPSGIRGVYDRHSYDAERLEWLSKWDALLNSLAP